MMDRMVLRAARARAQCMPAGVMHDPSWVEEATGEKWTPANRAPTLRGMSNVAALPRSGLIICLLGLYACSKPPAPADASTAAEPPAQAAESGPPTAEPPMAGEPSAAAQTKDLLPPASNNATTAAAPDTRGKAEIQQVVA